MSNFSFPTPIKCSILLSIHGWETLPSSRYQCLSRLFLKWFTVWACFTQSGKLFQHNATLWLNWPLLSCSLPGWGMSTFRCPLTCLVDVAPSLWVAMSNHKVLSTLSFPVISLYMVIMSPLVLLSTNVVNPTSLSLSSYSLPLKLLIILMALCCTCSKTFLSPSVHGDQAA